MARNYDRTLLSDFGFNDPDRQSAEHDVACRYLSSDAVLDKLETRYRPDREYRMPLRYGTRQVLRYDPEGIVDRVEFERVLSKGRGDYRKTIGFLDAVIHLEYPYEEETVEEGSGRQTRKRRLVTRRPIIAEVKIHRTEVGNILKQVNLYREHIDDAASSKDSPIADLLGYKFIVVTKFPLEADERRLLDDCGIHYFMLGDDFQQYLSKSGEDRLGGDDEVPPVQEL